MTATGLSPTMALVTFAAVTIGAVLLWLVLLAVVRRVAPGAVRMFNAAAAIAFAVLVNFLVFYLSALMCGAGLKEFLRNAGRYGSNPFLQLMLWFGGGFGRVPVDERHGVAIAPLFGTIVALFSMVAAHLLLMTGTRLAGWLQAIVPQREFLVRDYLAQGLEHERAEVSAAWQVNGTTIGLILGFTATALFFYLMVINFDVLLLQLQVAYLSGMGQDSGTGLPVPSAQLASPEELALGTAGTAGALVLKGLKWFYICMLLLAAYLWHAAWAGYRAMVGADAEQQRVSWQAAPDSGSGEGEITAAPLVEPPREVPDEETSPVIFRPGGMDDE